MRKGTEGRGDRRRKGKKQKKDRCKKAGYGRLYRKTLSMTQRSALALATSPIKSDYGVLFLVERNVPCMSHTIMCIYMSK